ncbi:hypothetical protein LCGC14_2098820, partial [marine sediment metagenome]
TTTIAIVAGSIASISFIKAIAQATMLRSIVSGISIKAALGQTMASGIGRFLKIGAPQRSQRTQRDKSKNHVDDLHYNTRLNTKVFLVLSLQLLTPKQSLCPL